MVHVLYVDDDETLLELCQVFLESSGQFTIDTSISAKAALEKLAVNRYDAIISDYEMPETNGIGILKIVRRDFGNIPFILFTGKGREEVVIQALNEGADFYLQKGGNPSALFAELTHKILSAVEHHRSVERIKSLNRLYSVLSATNKAIVKISTKEKFFSEICRILVETGGFCMAWIGLADPEHATIRPEASAGQTGEYLDHICISTEDVPLGRGPTGTAYRQGSCYFSNDITLDPNMEPWLEPALNHGYRANAALPFSLGTKNAGVLSLYAPVSGFFDDEIISLLKELAEAISFALRAIDEKTEREFSDAALRESEERFRTLYINMTEGAALHELVYTDKGTPDDYIILETNPAFEKQLALSRTAVIGKTSREAYGVADPPYLDIYSDVALTKKPVAFETYFAPMDKYFSISVYSPKKGRFATIFDDITERKKAEHELQEKTAELEDYFSKSLYLSCIADTDGYFRRLNPEWEKTLGYTLADLEGSRFLDFVHPDDLPRTLAVMGDLANKKNVVDFTNRFRHKDGSYRWIEWRSFPNPKNNLIFATAKDITARKQAEEALRESEDLYRALIQTTADGFYIVDTEGKILDANETYCRMTGYTRAELLTLHVKDVDAVETPGATKARMQRIIANKGEIFETRHRRKDGSVFDIVASVSFMERNGGRFICFCRDITVKKKAEQALLESEKRYHDMFDLNSAAMFIVNPQSGRIVDANAAASRYYGYSRKEFSRILITDINTADPLVTMKNMAHAVDNQGGVFTFRHRKKNGEIRNVFVFSTPVMVNGERLLYSVLQDVTEQRKAEQALVQANAKLNLLSGITRHDINNQLTALQAYLSLIGNTPPDTPKNKYLEKAEQAAERISAFIEFTREYESIGIQAPVWLDCRTLIDTAIRQAPLLDRVAAKNDIPAGVEMFADPLVVKVFYNLMDNAVRYGEKITSIRFSSRKHGDDYVIVCEDDGVGVPAEEKEKIFERGFGKHTGLGLALSREILSITGIMITETGEPGKGARFEITVPKGAYRFAGTP
jgi:PAS domain S-box-containing protein